MEYEEGYKFSFFSLDPIPWCVGPIEACIFRVIKHLLIHKVILVQFIFIAIVTIIYDYKHNCVCLYAVISIKKNLTGV
ncbi:hypothetical protein L1887_41881 [Cichorium endivia]|nr:hypothetical protein L1887_41881 [Cichorium endivia]